MVRSLVFRNIKEAARYNRMQQEYLCMETQVLLLDLPLIRCIILDKSLNLSRPLSSLIALSSLQVIVKIKRNHKCGSTSKNVAHAYYKVLLIHAFIIGLQCHSQTQARGANALSSVLQWALCITNTNAHKFIKYILTHSQKASS